MGGTMAEDSRSKSALLAHVSHELRTPLNTIIGFAELMHQGKVPAADHHEYLGDILLSAKQLLQLVNDALDLAQVEAGEMEFRPKEVDLAKLVAEARDGLIELATKKRIAIATKIEVDTAFVDPKRTKQILSNYLSNAIKFTPEGGRIEIRALPEGERMLRLEVEDTGMGIAEESLPKLFVPFARIEAGRARKDRGPGLGLALTRQLVEARGGRVEVKSAVGKGSTFSAILRRADEET